MSSVLLKCISLKSFLQNHIERFETIDPVDFLKRPPDKCCPSFVVLICYSSVCAFLEIEI